MKANGSYNLIVQEDHFDTKFSNTVAYDSYRLTFPNFSGSLFDIKEVELLKVDIASTLEVSQAELARITAGTLRIGNFDTGPIVVSADITRSAKTNIQLSSGKTIDRGGLRFATTGTFTSESTDDPVQVGFIPPPADVSVPRDTVTSVSGAVVAGFEATKAIDDQVSTKFASRGGAGSGLEVTLGRGATVIKALRLTTAGDLKDRDPASYKLEGKVNAGDAYTEISTGQLSLSENRNAVSTIPLNNAVAYTTYRLTFPSLRSSLQTTMQIGEVELVDNGETLAGFDPLLNLPGGVTIQGDKFSTVGKVSALAGSEVRDLFTGIVDGDANQRVLIPFGELTGPGFVISSNQTLESRIDANTSFRPTKDHS